MVARTLPHRFTRHAALLFIIVLGPRTAIAQESVTGVERGPELELEDNTLMGRYTRLLEASMNLRVLDSTVVEHRDTLLIARTYLGGDMVREVISCGYVAISAYHFSRGKRHGYFIEKDPDGVTLAHGVYEQDRLIGNWVVTDPEKRIRVISMMDGDNVLSRDTVPVDRWGMRLPDDPDTK